MGLKYLLHYLLLSKNFPYFPHFYYALLVALHTGTVWNFQRRFQGISMQCWEMHFCIVSVGHKNIQTVGLVCKHSKHMFLHVVVHSPVLLYRLQCDLRNPG